MLFKYDWYLALVHRSIYYNSDVKCSILETHMHRGYGSIWQEGPSTFDCQLAYMYISTMTDTSIGLVWGYHFPRAYQFTCMVCNIYECKENKSFLCAHACKQQDHDPVQHGNSIDSVGTHTISSLLYSSAVLIYRGLIK